MFCGLAIYAYYDHIGCDPYNSMQIENKDQLLPFFVANVIVWPGTVGLFIALLTSGSLSTISSIINSCSALTWSDFVSPCFSNITPKREIHIVKFISVFYGVVITAFAFLIASLDMNLFQVVYVAILSTKAPLDGLLFLGAAFSFVQWKGAVIGLCCSIILTSILTFGHYMNPSSFPVLPTDISSCTLSNSSYFIDPYLNTTTFDSNIDNESVFFLFRISFYWIAGIGWATTVIIGLIASIITRNPSESAVDSKVLIQWKQYFSVFSGNVQNVSVNDNDFELERIDERSKREKIQIKAPNLTGGVLRKDENNVELQLMLSTNNVS